MTAPRQRAPKDQPAATTRQTNYRLPLATTTRLEAAAAVLGVSQARIITDAVQAYIEGLPTAKRKVIEEVLAIRQKP